MLEPGIGDKRVKNISPAFKEVASSAYNDAAASPDVMETLSQTTISTLHTSRPNLEPSLSALVLNEAIHDRLARSSHVHAHLLPSPTTFRTGIIDFGKLKLGDGLTLLGVDFFLLQDGVCLPSEDKLRLYEAWTTLY